MILSYAKCEMEVIQPGLEPGTHGLKGRCSTD